MKNLTSKALLVNLNICQWSARKYDRKVTKEVNEAHNSTDAGRFNKLLIATEHLKEIQQIGTKARDFHYTNTLPWSDSGDRLLPAKNYFEYTQKLSEIKTEFEIKVRAFVANYAFLVEDAKTRLNGLFLESDYPKDIDDRFKITVSFMPVPDVTDFRVDLSQAEVDDLKDQIESSLNDRYVSATTSIYQRIVDQLKHMHERLDSSEKVFKNSLFDNLKELVDLLPRLNITGDTVIDALCVDLKSLIVDPDDVRKSERLRKDKGQRGQRHIKEHGQHSKP